MSHGVMSDHIAYIWFPPHTCLYICSILTEYTALVSLLEVYTWIMKHCVPRKHWGLRRCRRHEGPAEPWGATGRPKMADGMAFVAPQQSWRVKQMDVKAAELGLHTKEHSIVPSMQHHIPLALYSSPHKWKHKSFRDFEFWEMWNRILLNLKLAFPQVGSAWKRGFSLQLVSLFGFVGLPMMSSAVPIHCPLRRWRTSWAAQHEDHRASKEATWCHEWCGIVDELVVKKLGLTSSKNWLWCNSWSGFIANPTLSESLIKTD